MKLIHIAGEQSSAIKERQKIFIIISTLYRDYHAFSKDSFRYLENKKIEYHKWIFKRYRYI